MPELKANGNSAPENRVSHLSAASISAPRRSPFLEAMNKDADWQPIHDNGRYVKSTGNTLVILRSPLPRCCPAFESSEHVSELPRWGKVLTAGPPVREDRLRAPRR